MCVCDCVLVQDKQKSTVKMTIQQLSDTVLDSLATPWTELPEYVFETVVEHVQGDKKASTNFRHVCHPWREAHDRLVSGLKPKGALPDASVWKKFGGVKTVNLTSSLVNYNDLRALAPLTRLTILGRHSTWACRTFSSFWKQRLSVTLARRLACVILLRAQGDYCRM
jgi:hypothetical protein